MPLISVIMPVYNAGPFLREAISSILCQTEADFEFIIINDGSSDDSESVILSFNDPRIRYIKNSFNQGLISTLNKALDLAQGRYIARMDNDDVSDPSRFEKQLKLLTENPGVAMACSPIIGITPGGKPRDPWPADYQNRSSAQIASVLPKENCIAHPSVFARAEVLKKYRYHPSQKGSEDWDLWLRMTRDGHRILKTEEVLLKYRIHQGSITGRYNRDVSPQLKSMGVKCRFFVNSVAERRLNWFVIKTLLFTLSDYAYYLRTQRLPYLAKRFKWLLSISPFKALKSYRSIRSALSDHSSSLFFFFPYSHLGGAEKVHAQITAVFEKEKPYVFFTGLHNQADHSAQFGSAACIIHAAPGLYHPFFAGKSKKLIVQKIETAKNPVVFGANNLFFEDLILAIRPDIYVADLTHDISYGAETTQRELDAAFRPQARIFISNHAVKKTLDYYEANFADETDKEKIRLIYNYVNLPRKQAAKNWILPFKVLYVGRDTREKRVDRIFELAKKAEERSLPFVFEFAGNIKRQGVPASCRLQGQVLDQEKLSSLYHSAHFVIISSESEGFPLSIMEGMAHGCIPLSTAVGDIPFHIKHGSNGFLADANEQVVIASFLAILENLVLRDDLELMSYACFEYASHMFSKQRFENEYLKLLSPQRPGS